VNERELVEFVLRTAGWEPLVSGRMSQTASLWDTSVEWTDGRGGVIDVEKVLKES
jgi:hypothetical protein